MSSLCWISATSERTLAGGRAQKTRQCRQSLKPGSTDRSSSLARISSGTTPEKSGARSLAFCWALRFVRCFWYRAWISFCHGSVGWYRVGREARYLLSHRCKSLSARRRGSPTCWGLMSRSSLRRYSRPPWLISSLIWSYAYQHTLLRPIRSLSHPQWLQQHGHATSKERKSYLRIDAILLTHHERQAYLGGSAKGKQGRLWLDGSASLKRPVTTSLPAVWHQRKPGSPEDHQPDRR